MLICKLGLQFCFENASAAAHIGHIILGWLSLSIQTIWIAFFSWSIQKDYQTL